MRWKNLWSSLFKNPTFENVPLKTMDPSTTSPTPTTTEATSTIIAGTIRPLEIAPGKIYELSQQQYNQLWNAANREGMALLVPSPKFDDAPQYARDLLNLCQGFEDLLALGLVVDVSSLCEDNVREAWEERGRHVRFMCISDAGKLMFEDSKKRPVN